MISCSKILDIIRPKVNRIVKKAYPNVMILFDNRGHRMSAENYWEQFLSTGKIDDYLAYRNTDVTKMKALCQSKGRPDGDEGAGEGAGTGQFYRDDFKG